MKYVLNEHKKFILEEKFILKEAEQLTEASIADVALTWTENFKEISKKIKMLLEKFIKYAGISNDRTDAKNTFNKVKDDINNAWEEMEVSLSLPEKNRLNAMEAIKAELEQYIKALEAVKQEIKDEKSEYKMLELGARITKLSALNSKATWDRKDLSALTDHHSWIKATIIPLFDTADIELSEENVKKFRTTCNSCLKLITDINANLPNIFTNFDKSSLMTYISAMQYFEKIEEWVDKWSAIKENKVHGLIKANIDTLSKQVIDLETSYKKINNSSVIQTNTKKTDWAAKYNDAVNKDAVWEEYLETVWFKDASEDTINRIKSISNALKQECISYGFDNTNPFITFINETYLKTTMPKYCYEAIHNAVVEEKVKVKDLTGEGELGKYNIIFCQDLYTKEDKSVSAYLKRQSDLISRKFPENVFSSKKEFVVNIMYMLESTTTIDNLDISKLKLNTFDKINELEKTYTGSTTSENKSDKDTVVINDSIIDSIENTAEATQILGVIALKFAANSAVTDSLVKYKEISDWLVKNTTITDLFKTIKNIDNKFKLTGINTKQALNLINKIIGSSKFTFTKL